MKKVLNNVLVNVNPASTLYKSTAGRYRPVSYPDGPITARYRFIKNAHWERHISDCAADKDLRFQPLESVIRIQSATAKDDYTVQCIG